MFNPMTVPSECRQISADRPCRSPGELVEGGGEYAYGGDRVVDGGEFCRCVAAAVLALSEYHRDFRDLGHVLGVVAGTAVHAKEGDVLLAGRVFEGCDDRRVA